MRGGGDARRKCVSERSDRKIQSVDGELGSHAVNLGLLCGGLK
jgi:hypothetical protein